MKKRGIVFLLLCLLLCFTLTACKKEKTDVDSGKEDVLVMDDGSGDVVKELTESGYNLIENKTTTYKIVIPDDPVDMVSEAALELQYFLSEATGVKLEIVKDGQVSETDAVISLGHTNVAKTLGVTTTEADDLGISGYCIKTVGKSIVIMDAEDSLQKGYGVLCGVYGFLEDTIGLVVYTMDEIFYEKLETVPLHRYDEVVKPSYDVRFIEGAELRSDETYRHRMKLLNYSTEDWWPLAVGHNQVGMILPYTEEHKDWYTSDGKQLCWSAGEELETAFANRVIEIIQENPNGVYFMLGQEDFVKGCTCEKCVQNTSADKYGSYAGLQIVFLNSVIDKVEAWREVNAPERDIRYMCYAYAYTLMAPTKEDASGNIVPYSEACRPSEKLYIRYAPLEADFSKEMEDPANQAFRQAAEGWAAIAPGRVMGYLYGCNFRNWFVNFDNFDVMQNHYEFYSGLGFDLMYSHAVMYDKVAAFKEMRVFVESQLLWNLDLNYDKLVNKFMIAYYKDAAQGMRKYYDCIKKIYDDNPSVGGGRIYASIANAYTIESVEEMDKYIKEALQAIEHLRNTDNEQFKTLYYRIKKEELSVLWLKLSKFNLRYTEQELNDFTLEFYYLCDEFGIDGYKSQGYSFPIGDMFFKYLLDE